MTSSNPQPQPVWNTLFGKMSAIFALMGGILFCAGPLLFAWDQKYALFEVTSFVLGVGLFLAGLTGAVLVRTDQWKLITEKSTLLSGLRWSVIFFNVLYAIFSAWSTYSAMTGR